MIQDVFDKVKQEEPLKDIENFFINANDIFDNDEISESDKRFIMDLIDRTTFIADTKKFVEDTEAAIMEIVVQPSKKKLKKGSKFRLIMTKSRRKRMPRII